MTLAAIELGGTKALVAIGQEPASHTAPIRLATTTPELTLQAIFEALQTHERTGARLSAVGIATFGPVQLDPSSPDHGRLLKTPKPGWTGADLLGPLSAAFDVPVAIETDVNAAALAEGRWGAAAGTADHAYITVGTGVGVGIVANGRAVHGAGHPEGGHLWVRMRVDDEFPGVCPWHGDCVEGLTSGPALRARLGRPGADIAADDEIWDLCGDYLAQLCMSLVLVNAPERIVIGGGVGSRPELIASIRRHLRRHLNGYLERLDSEAAMADLIRPAALEHAGLMGAFLLAAAL